MTPAYSLRRVSFAYEGPPILDKTELVIRKGEIMALVGPNGSGKTTLLHLLAFLEFPKAGEIEFFGEKPHKGNVLELRRRVGLLLQTPYLFHETVMANMTWGLRLRGISRPDARDAALKGLDMVGLAGFENRYARSLSGGESQRVALARALVLEPSVLLLDEPSNHMDRSSALQTEELIVQLNRDHGRTIVITTHAVERVHNLAHRVVHMRRGKVVPAGADNLFSGELSGQGMVFDTGNMSVHLASRAEEASCMAIDPEGITLLAACPKPGNLNVFSGTVQALSAENGRVRVDVDAGERLRVFVSSDDKVIPDLHLGRSIWVTLKPDAVRVF